MANPAILPDTTMANPAILPDTTMGHPTIFPYTTRTAYDSPQCYRIAVPAINTGIGIYNHIDKEIYLLVGQILVKEGTIVFTLDGNELILPCDVTIDLRGICMCRNFKCYHSMYYKQIETPGSIFKYNQFMAVGYSIYQSSVSKTTPMSFFVFSFRGTKYVLKTGTRVTINGLTQLHKQDGSKTTANDANSCNDIEAKARNARHSVFLSVNEIDLPVEW
jgi:hypothetical protein